MSEISIQSVWTPLASLQYVGTVVPIVRVGAPCRSGCTEHTGCAPTEPCRVPCGRHTACPGPWAPAPGA